MCLVKTKAKDNDFKDLKHFWSHFCWVPFMSKLPLEMNVFSVKKKLLFREIRWKEIVLSERTQKPTKGEYLWNLNPWYKGLMQMLLMSVGMLHWDCLTVPLAGTYSQTVNGIELELLALRCNKKMEHDFYGIIILHRTCTVCDARKKYLSPFEE